ncbi:hypothetical protein LX32DRAFT_646384 [Colletotrichum zoysiae]|uniref:Uncharacterized protein n=1 Tax=Colletotrichum zoysiae TaxID=1216348 RepID=A0AAD9H3Q0_9PEZI|nr:hypothetical protein LX32DRAFT_646384 [Colletotrichum zoysiae]
MHLRSLLAAAIVASGGVHSLRLGLPGVALSMAFTLGRPTLVASDVTADDGLERRQGESLCMSIDPSECVAVKRDENTDGGLEKDDEEE